ncbi:DUF4430 domain-containing protein [Allocoprobacillus halotolerans]|uniref:DUF4430 domain-containing protein n=1 Tax=Allocoprobacillus halotolerans TaxID=2944914 RepID=A0ABY5I557_9FIRM|nr:DUF4430 domain-containing protein [Allocoprobacillus halotolerans]UTY40497.1 DUF4430 domain-containing protein [Allocoprobacillus halotolerans]
MNKTKKYTLVFIVVCFVLIGGAGIYHACFAPSQTSQPVVKTPVEQEVIEQEEKTEQESKQETEKSQQTPISKDKESITQKQESQTTQQTETTSPSKTETSEEETTPSHSTETEEETEIEEVSSVNVTITGVDSVMAQDYIEFEEGMSAYDALKILADNYDMSVKVSGVGQAVYVKGINGLNEFDYGGRSGWKYKVNGSYPSVGAGSYVLKDGDQVEWIYSTNG